MKKMMMAAALTTLSASAIAEWSQIASGDGQDIYVDRSTIRRSGKTVKMWNLLDLWAPKYKGTGDPYASSKGQVEYDCKNELARLLYFSNHSGQMGGGQTVDDRTIPNASWEPIPPESIVEGFWKIACGK